MFSSIFTPSSLLSARFHTAIVNEASLSLSLNPFPLSDSDSDASFTTIEPSLSLKWVQYPLIRDVAITIAILKHCHRPYIYPIFSDVAIAIAIAVWKWATRMKSKVCQN